MLRLGTPLDRCIRNVIARQRVGGRGRASVERTAIMQEAGIEEACRRLRRHARVEVLDFDGALLRARELLGLGGLGAAAWGGPGRWPGSYVVAATPSGRVGASAGDRTARSSM